MSARIWLGASCKRSIFLLVAAFLLARGLPAGETPAGARADGENETVENGGGAANDRAPKDSAAYVGAANDRAANVGVPNDRAANVGALKDSAANGGDAGRTSPGFQERTFHDQYGEHKYTLFVPAGYTPEKKWPVILYLHGSSARGTDNKLPLVGGLAPQLRARAQSFPFLVVIPQCEDRDSRLLDGWLASSADGTRAIQILDAVERDFNVDRRHEILTGWSMGATGAWSLAAETPARWSALVIVAGSGDPATAPRLKDVPIWAFHGTRDFTVPFEQGQKMAVAVREAGGRVFFTEMPAVRHNIAHVVYGDDAVYEWMLDPSREPRPEGIVRNAARVPNEAEMGHDFVHPFIPAVEIPQSLYVRLDKDAIESLVCALPELVPADALSGSAPDVHQTQRRMMTRFNIALSGITYRGTLEQIEVTTRNDGKATIALGLRNMTTEIGMTQINGRIMSATAGPMDIVIGHQRPVWLKVEVRPYIEERRIRLELGETHFEIPDDNWYVTTPQVTTRGLPFGRRRVSNAISSRLVQETYGRKGEIESQVLQSAPQLLKKLEDQLDQALAKTRTIGAWPMPAYQPPFRLWPERLRVDEAGLALVVGITVGRPALDERDRPLKRIERPQINFDDMPRDRGLQFGMSGAFLEGFTAAVVDAGVAAADTQDLHTTELRALGETANIVDAIPDLARYGDQLQVRARLQALEPMLFGAAPPDEIEAPVADARQSRRRPRSAVQLRMPRVRLAVDIKTGADQRDWRRCAEFEIRLSQRIELKLQRPEFEKRVVRLQRPQDAEIAVTGRFDDGYNPLDGTLRIERLAERFREGWRAAEHMELLQQMSASDLKVGTANLRIEEVGWVEPFLIRRYTPAGTRITNGGQQPLVYQVRGRLTAWGGPYTLEPGKSHDFKVPYPLTMRQVGVPETADRMLQMGSHFVYLNSGPSQPATAVGAIPAEPNQ